MKINDNRVIEQHTFENIKQGDVFETLIDGLFLKTKEICWQTPITRETFQINAVNLKNGELTYFDLGDEVIPVNVEISIE